VDRNPAREGKRPERGSSDLQPASAIAETSSRFE
jgi:hypothetical protein